MAKRAKKQALSRPKTSEEIEKEDLGALYNLDVLDQVILRALVKEPGISTEALMDKTGLTERAIRTRRYRAVFKDAYGELQGTTVEHLKEAARRGAARLKKLVDDEDKPVALSAIRIALAPYVNKTSVDVNMAPRTVFKTTVQTDGSLLQEVLAEELGVALSDAAQAAEARIAESQATVEGEVVERKEGDA